MKSAPKAKRGSRHKHSRTRVRDRMKKWQARFLIALRKAPSVFHACKFAGIDRSTAYRARDNDAVFAEKWSEALEASVDGLVAAAFRRALKSSDTLLTFLLRCHRPAIYNISSRIEQIGDAEEKKKVGVTIYYQTGDRTFAELTNFPVDSSMAAPAASAGTPEPAAQSDAPEPEVPAGYDGLPPGYDPPPKTVPKWMTGRIPPEWKDGHK